MLLTNHPASRDRPKDQSPLISLLFQVRDEFSVADDQLSSPGEDPVRVDLVPLDPSLHLGDRLFLGEQRGLGLLAIWCADLIVCSARLVSHRITMLARGGNRTAFPWWHIRAQTSQVTPFPNGSDRRHEGLGPRRPSGRRPRYSSITWRRSSARPLRGPE